jgi:hypothetical protein
MKITRLVNRLIKKPQDLLIRRDKDNRDKFVLLYSRDELENVNGMKVPTRLKVVIGPVDATQIASLKDEIVNSKA